MTETECSGEPGRQAEVTFGHVALYRLLQLAGELALCQLVAAGPTTFVSALIHRDLLSRALPFVTPLCPGFPPA